MEARRRRGGMRLHIGGVVGEVQERVANGQVQSISPVGVGRLNSKRSRGARGAAFVGHEERMPFRLLNGHVDTGAVHGFCRDLLHHHWDHLEHEQMVNTGLQASCSNRSPGAAEWSSTGHIGGWPDGVVSGHVQDCAVLEPNLCPITDS